MRNRCLLEITVESVEAAAAAERGGADRIELCAKLAAGGLTPSVELIAATRKQVHVPIFAMIRPRRGGFVYSEAELRGMREQITAAKRLGMDGVVLGILQEDRGVDVARTRELVELAEPLPVTFHRAFDECADLDAALEDVIRTGAARILTSGGAANAVEGAATLARVVAAAGERITIVAGAGLNALNIARVAQETRASEFHSGLSSVFARRDASAAQFEREVQRLAAELRREQNP